jgi:hypothetical protein
MGLAWGIPKGLIPYRLALLFDMVHPRDRGCLTNSEVAEAANREAGKPVITEEDLSQLRRGEEADPGLAAMSAVARVFGVSVAFFTAEMTDAQARDAADAVRRGVREQMTTGQVALELHAAASTAIETVINRWAASGAVVQSPSGIRPVSSRLVSPN